jgi:lipopolysaccharide assembly outer membrane protein LptD (OstA)
LIKVRNIRNCALFSGAFFLTGFLFAQQNILELLPGSEKIYFDKKSNVHRLVGSVSFNYQGNTMFCDSAHYQERNKIVRAYGNVQIRKDDINLFCDSLFYNGSSKYAKLWGHVRVRDSEYKITTDSMDYDSKNGKGIYRHFGKIESIISDEKITSKTGYFYPQKKSFFFSGNVNYKKEKLAITTDTLQFSYEKQTAYFFGPTKILNDSVTVICKKGWYNVEKKEGALFKKAEIIQKNSLIRGDTLFYNGAKQSYEGRGNVFYKDYEKNMIFLGNKAYSSNEKHYSYLTGKALALKVQDKDTVYIHADSLHLYKDTLNKTKEITGNRNVKIYNKSIQCISDSAFYQPDNNLLFLRSNPIVWARNAELKGTKMDITLTDTIIEKIVVTGEANVIMEVDSGKYYNQISGKDMTAWFDENKIVRTDVKGNACTIYFPEEETKTDTTFQKKRLGMNRVFASELRIYLDSGEVKGITYFEKPEGVFYPMNQINKDEQFIKGFNLNPVLRPKSGIKIIEK